MDPINTIGLLLYASKFTVERELQKGKSMKIRDIRCQIVAVPYKNPYRIAPGTTKAARRVIVRVDGDDGLYGIGETGVTVPERGGETVESIALTTLNYFKPKLLGMNAFQIANVIDVLERSHWGGTGFLCAKAGIDNALFDLMGKAMGRPVAELLGGNFRTTFKVSRSLGVKTPEEMGAEALKLKEQGYAMLTVKAGFDPATDLNRVAAVREAVGQHYPLEIDVNGGYPNLEVALPTMKKMAKYDIEAVEQPLPWHDVHGLRDLRRAIDFPITADESAWTPQDVANLAKLGAVDSICIKPIKNGGLHLSRRMAEIADASGMGVLMGSKHPLSYGTAAIIHFAAAFPFMHETIGYGSPLERFVDDVCEDPIEMADDGSVSLPEGAGFGVSLSAEKMATYAEPFPEVATQAITED